MSGSHANICREVMARELGGRRPGTATGNSRKLYPLVCPNSKAQQVDMPEVHICRFSPCGQYLVCFAGGFTQLVVYRFTGPRLSWRGELDDQELAAKLASFGCFFSLLYRVALAPPGELFARDVVLFMCGGALVLLASHTPYTLPVGPPPADADPLLSLPYAESINLHLVRLSDGVRLSGSRLECELVDLSGRPGSLGVSAQEDLIVVLAVRSQVIHLLQVLRGGEEVVPVRCLGPYVSEDDELVLQTAAEAEERWLRARMAEREAGCGAARAVTSVPPRPAPEDAPVAAALPPLRRSINGDLVRDPSPAAPHRGAPGAAAQSQLSASGVQPPGPGPSAAAAAGGPAGAVGTSGRRPDSAAPGPVGGAAGRPADGMGVRQAEPMPPPGGDPQGGGVSVSMTASPGGVSRTVTSNDPGPGGGSAGPPPGDRNRGHSPAPRVAIQAATDGGLGSGSDPVVHLQPLQGVGLPTAPPALVAVLYPPEHRRQPQRTPVAAAAAGGGSSTVQWQGGTHPTPADTAAATAHQARVRRQIRQQQFDELVAQGGPGQQPPRRSSPAPGAAIRGAGAVLQPPQLALPGRGVLMQHQQHLYLGFTGRAAEGASLPLTLHQHQHQQYLPQPSLAARQPARQPPQRRAAPRPVQAPQQPQQQLHRQQLLVGAGGLAGHLQGRQPAGSDGGGGPAAGANGLAGEGGSVFVTGIKQRLLAHLYGNCMRLHPNNPRRQQREALALFRHFETYRSLLIRKVYMLDRTTLLIDMRTPAGADLGGLSHGAASAAPSAAGPGMPPSHFFLLFDLHTTRVVSFKASPGDKVIERYVREATSAAAQPWAESLPPWERFTYDSVLAEARRKLKHRVSGSLLAAGAGHGGHLAAPSADSSSSTAAERASCSCKLMQLMPPASGTFGLSSSPYLDTTLFTYDDRVISPHIRIRPCLEQPISLRPRNRPDRAGFRLDPGPYEAMIVRDRRLARNVAHLFHPDAPFLLAVFSVFRQDSMNINFRL